MTCGLKICGITRPEDLQLCAEVGITAVGINLWAGSSRGVALGDATRWPPRAAGDPRRVGVFVHHDADEIARAVGELQLDAIQVHDDRPAQWASALGWPWIWVIRGTPELTTLRVPTHPPLWALLDARVDGFGGQGQRTDWTWAAEAVRALAPLPVWLAGGVTPGNAASAIATVRPAGLDVASGAESPGHPGPKVRRQVEALWGACVGTDALQPEDP